MLTVVLGCVEAAEYWTTDHLQTELRYDTAARHVLLAAACMPLPSSSGSSSTLAVQLNPFMLLLCRLLLPYHASYLQQR
jgi:hypothetical protein